MGMKQKCCNQNLQSEQHPIDGVDGTTDGAKLQYKLLLAGKAEKQKTEDSRNSITDETVKN